MQEILIGLIVALDVVALYLLLPTVKQRFFLSLWTALLHMIFPIIGFTIGSMMVALLMQWSNVISSIILFFIGLHLILSTQNRQINPIPVSILAISASLDTFSVSVSFGMLNLQKYLFIASAGIWTFFLSYISLTLARKGQRKYKGNSLKWIAGISLMLFSIYALVNN